MPSNFHNLEAYRLAVVLADEVYWKVREWSIHDQMTCGTQLIRSLDSIGANIAESTGRWHPGEKRQLYVIARGSLHEAEHWLSRAHSRGLIEEPLAERLPDVARALNGLIKRPLPTANRELSAEK